MSRIAQQLIILPTVLSLWVGIPNANGQGKLALEIIPLGPIETEAVNFLRNNLSQIFDANISISTPREIPSYAFDKNRKQYHSSAILNDLANLKRNQRQIVLAIIDRDLYVPDLNFVFGEADIQHSICIISLTRLHQAFYGLPEDKNLFLTRALTEAVHEIGHLFNLGHCQNPRCVMFFSNRLSDTDRKGYHFCRSCQQLLGRGKDEKIF